MDAGRGASVPRPHRPRLALAIYTHVDGATFPTPSTLPTVAFVMFEELDAMSGYEQIAMLIVWAVTIYFAYQFGRHSR